ncbi:MAG TPA: hypothetical protein VHZ78_02250 [Rhizomicrobium sp.]|jgi:hypothetical protein|nr:hypothetical protein [Rhizomicrobium sp.]
MGYALKPELNVVASPALLERGCVNIIKLDEIKREAGPRWEKLRGSVSAHLEALLRQKLGSSDFFVQVDDTAFLVSMPSSSAEMSQIFCLRIAHELHTSMLGPCALGQLRLAKAVRVQDDEILSADIEGTELARLAIAAGLAGIPESARLAARRAAPRPSQAPEFLHRYVPLWDAQREALSTWRCVTDAPAAGAGSSGNSAKQELAATLSRIRHAAHTLTEHMKAGERFLVSIPVSYDTLTSPAGRMDIVAICRGLASALRPYLIFEIGELPYGVPQSRLSELVCALKPFCRAVAGLLPARISSYAAYQSAGLNAIGVSLVAGGAGTTDMSSEIFKLCIAAKRLHILSFVLDAVTQDAIRVARDQGANLISSPLIGSAAASPLSVRRLSARDVLSASLGQRDERPAEWLAVG